MNSALIAWAQRHVPVDPLRALHELHMLLGLDYPDDAPSSAAATEAGVQSRARLALSAQGGRAWRNNVGAVDPNDPPDSFLRYGLANDSKQMNDVLKSSDLIGIKPVLVTPQHVGSTIGQFWARECKYPGWRYTAKGREPAQLNFINLVNRLGGDAAFTNGSNA